jgi:integrase
LLRQLLQNIKRYEEKSPILLIKYKKQDVYLETLEYNFITGFEHFLKVREGIEHNTAMGYIKRVKRIINISFNNQWINANPFASFVCTTRKVVRTELTEDEMQKLAEKEFKVKRLEEVRDAFLFCCYTGYAFIDASKLSPSHIIATKDNELWVNASRTKTEITANVPLLPQAIAIINKYKEHPECVVRNKLLPMKSNQKMIAYLKEISDLCA